MPAATGTRWSSWLLLCCAAAAAAAACCCLPGAAADATHHHHHHNQQRQALRTADSFSDSGSDSASLAAANRQRRAGGRDAAVLDLVDRGLAAGPYRLTSAISLEPVAGAASLGESSAGNTSSQKIISINKNSDGPDVSHSGRRGRAAAAAGDDLVDHVVDRVDRFARSHVVKVRLGQLARDLSSGDQRDRCAAGVVGASNGTQRGCSQGRVQLHSSRTFSKLFGKNSFLTGFGLGFLAFGLKKLLLPFFIGAQIVKSILIAMFLPSILGSVGKLVGKGVTTFATSSAQNGGFSGSSGSNALGGGGDNMEDFDFKDNGAAGQYPDAASSGSEMMPSYATLAAPPSGFNALQTLQRPSDTGDGQPLGTLPAMFQAAASAATNVLANRYQPKTSYAHRHQYTGGGMGGNSVLDGGGSFYNRHKPHDFKTFQNIPSSSMLLTHYDPFYSPLLSRLDSVFHQLGYQAEACRERLVCAMYRNPAKFAPFSNLVSAQLSRDLNELRKPSSDNPEILRFFRYMKAAKDGQDNQDCSLVYATCTQSDAAQASPMAHTFQDINKLVEARRMSRILAADHPAESVATLSVAAATPAHADSTPSSGIGTGSQAVPVSVPLPIAVAGYQSDGAGVNGLAVAPGSGSPSAPTLLEKDGTAQSRNPLPIPSPGA